MRGILKSYWNFFNELRSERLFVRFVGGLWALWGTLAFFRDELGIPNLDRWKFVNLVVQISGHTWLLIGLVLLVVWVIESSFRVLNRMRLRNIELSKIDSADLERMLNGRFCFGRFVFGNDGHHSGRFTGTVELGELRDKFIEMKVPAPKRSIAHIRLSFMTIRSEQGIIRFFFRDHDGNPQLIENIYDEVDVPVNDQGKFALQFVCDPGYNLYENASLDVWAKGWTK